MKRQQTKEQIYTAFAERLNRAMADKGYLERDRARTLKDWTGLDSVEAPRKWLRAMSMPRRANMAAICAQLGVRKNWLEDGEEPIWDSPAEGALEKQLQELETMFREAGPERSAEAVRVIRALMQGDVARK